jgi:kynurenine formamidase
MAQTKTIFLSRFLENNMPCYNGENAFYATQRDSIASGKTTNSLTVHMSNHVGTHVDFPSHFINNGKTLSDYPAERFIFSRPFICRIPMDCGEYITADALISRGAPQDLDLLIIKTGYGRFYRQDKYWNDNPGIDKSAAEYIKSNFKKIRGLGVDFISINAHHDKEPGRQAHIALLSAPEVLIIEDMSLPTEDYHYSRVIVAPMPIRNADGAPCAVIAEIQ